MKCYVIIRGWGEYSDRGREITKVYLSKEKAQAVMAALEKIENDCNALVEQEVRKLPGQSGFEAAWKYRNEIMPKVAKQYAALGFEAGSNDDWELAEAEFVG